jgi:hypothetical protein
VSTPPDPPPGRPTVDDVAELLRARTKDSAGNEVGTFDDDTRPTADQVEQHIDTAYALVSTRIPPLDDLPADLLPAFAGLVAYRAAMRIEKAYFPEQVQSGRSPYEQLRQEYLDDLDPFVQRANDAVAAGEEEIMFAFDMGDVPIGSWTSIPGSFIAKPSGTPDELPPP